MDNEVTQHPSMAVLGFSRVQCSGVGVALNGSHLTHTTVIQMTLQHAEKHRKLNNDRFFDRGVIAQAYLSQNQFAELITSMNVGSGIPVTLTMTEKDGPIDTPLFENAREKYETEFAKTAKKAALESEQLVADARELLAGSGTLKKVDRETLVARMEALASTIGSTMPYVEKCFQEAMDDTVTDARSSIQAFCQQRVEEAGLTALAAVPSCPSLASPGEGAEVSVDES